MNYKRLLGSAVAVTVFEFIYGWITCGWLFKWVYEIQPTVVWRDMTNATGGYWFAVILANFLVAIIYTVVFAKISGSIGGGSTKKGFYYGIMLWFISTLPASTFTYLFMNIAGGVAIYWLLVGIVELPIVGLLIAKIYRT